MKVVSVNTSLAKGTIKEPVEQIELDAQGVVGDAHAGAWHRQVSLLAQELIEEFAQKAGREIAPGEFAENITLEGLAQQEVRIFDGVRIGEVEMQITQIGKKCHGDSCAIYREVGQCIMPHVGLFARVLNGGTIRPGDRAEYLETIVDCRVLTLSDRAVAGDYEDRSGPLVERLLAEQLDKDRFRGETSRLVLPDDGKLLEEAIREAVDQKMSIIVTTGGTGIGPRDITPDVVRPMLDKEIPGIMEHVRMKFGSEKPGALISRSIAGVIDETLIFCLPGSVRAVEEYMGEIGQVLGHLLNMLAGIDRHG